MRLLFGLGSDLWSEDGDLICENCTGLHQTPTHALEVSPVRGGIARPLVFSIENEQETFLMEGCNMPKEA